LFVEEMTKMLLESANSVQSDAETGDEEAGFRPPETLRDSLTARLDRLGSAKMVAQTCAVIGRSVRYDLLKTVTDLPTEKFHASLEKLIDAELMSCRGIPPHAEYTFKHALVQDTAYQSMLSNKRKAIHRGIAEAINEHFPVQMEQQPEIIAHHYLKAGNSQLALDYLEKAARRTLGRSNYVEGINYLNQALAIACKEPESDERIEREIRIQTALGGAMIATRGFASSETGAVYARAASLVKKIGGDTSKFHPVRYGVWVFNLVRSELDVAYELAKEFVTAAEAMDDTVGHLAAYRTMGSCLTFMGRWEDSIDYLERALALYDIEQHRSMAVTYAQDPRISSLSLYSWSLLHSGRINDAIKSSDMAVNEAKDFEHLHTTAYTLGITGTMFHQFCGNLERTREGADALVDLCSKQPVPLWTNLGFCLQGWAIGMGGDIEAGIQQLDKGYDGFSGTGARLFMAYYCTLKAEMLVEGGNSEAALDCLDRARNLQDSNEEGWFAAGRHRIDGDLSRRMGLDDRAQKEYRAGLELAGKREDIFNQLRCTMGLVVVTKDTAKKQALQKDLGGVCDGFAQGEDFPILLQARALLK